MLHRIAQRPRVAAAVLLAVAMLAFAGASPEERRGDDVSGDGSRGDNRGDDRRDDRGDGRSLQVRIDSITPSSAARGELVTITGIGFGADNVHVSVGGVAAQVLVAIGNSATFRVPFGARPGATTVTATNPGGHSGRIAFTVVNRAPQANAGPDQTVFVTSTVQLNGAASSDADGDQLTFHWSFLSRPSGSNAVLSDPAAVRPTFVVDLPGRYTIQLIVNDGFANSPPDTVLIDTQNSPPIANAGPDQTVFVGATVQLDGSGSSDVDHDLLTFRWSFLSRPSGSNATLSDPTAPSPTFIVDLPGRYVVQLIVNDGTVDSRPDTVTIDTQNSRPVAHAGPDQIVTLGQTAQLDGSQSFDVDHDLLSFRWSFVSRPAGSTAVISDVTAVSPTFVPDLTGVYVVQLIVNDGTTDSQADTAVVTVNPPNRAPSVDAGPDQTITLPNTAALSGSATDDGLPPGSILTVAWSKVSGPGSVTFANASAAQTTAAFSLAGLYVLRLTASDGELSSSADLRVTVNPANQAPVVDAGPDQTITLPAAATLNGTVTDDGLPPGATLTIAWTAVSGPGTVTLADPSVASTTATFSTSGQYVLRLTANDSQISSSDEVTVTVNPAAGGLPPDPGTVAPQLNPAIATDMKTSTDFLYTGANPIQTGVVPGTIELRRAAVLRGKVLTRDGAALPGVRMSVPGHPEFGQTLSRADGMFDMAVNGGGFLTVRYEKSGFLSAQRQINVPWQDFALLPDVVLIQLDSQVTTVDLSASTPIQVARGNSVTDADGTRQATLLFTQGTTATMVMPDGSTRPLTALNVRATEFTVGANGPKTMPGELPPTSGYTYAVEFSADEAIAAGAKTVTFSQPVIQYVENFLNFPVGLQVPVGLYDREKSAWIPSDDGRVIRITGVSGSLANVDTVGNGSLPPLALSEAERQQLATLYQPGQTLWRVPIPHFSTPWDNNWPFGCDPEDCSAPNVSTVKKSTAGPTCPPGDDTASGSIIQCQSQSLGETVPITGTPFHLRYSSEGRRPGLIIPVIGADVPQNLLGAEVEISIAGQLFAQSFPPRENQVYRFAWDPKDAYGRKVEGSAQALVRLGYTYPAVYQKPAPFPQSFAALSGLSLNLLDQTGTRANFTLWQETRVVLESRSSPVPQVGGWSLSAHHTYDPVAKVLQQGDGTRRDAQAIGNAISTVAGNGVSDFAGDGGPATQASLNGSFGVAVAPDGSFYIADTINDRIRRVGPDGIISTVAGNGTSGFSGDGGPAQGAALRRPQGVAVAPDGSLYIADTGNARIRRVGPDGIIRTVAGNGTVQFGGDGGPATQAGLGNPVGVAVSPDGGLYIADTGHHRVRRVGPDGIITTVAGNGGFVGDGVPATQAELKTPYGVAVARDGSVYIADRDDGRIRRVGPDGIITTVAGNGTLGFGGDGGPATQALLDALGVAVAPDGGFYIADPNNGRIRRVGPDGIINTVAGNAFGQFSGDSGLATLAGIGAPTNVAVAPDGSLYIADNAFSIRRVSVPLPSFSDRLAVASEDGSELYLFSVDGRHTQTLNTLTGAIRYQFTYDSDGRLTAVTDGDGNISTIERDPSGNPTAIVAPFGQRTTLAVNADGYLARITNPAGEAVQLAYTSDGLLTSFIDARGNGSSYTYDDAGRLTRAEDPAGGFKSLTRTDTENGHTVSLLTAMGRTTTYRVDTLPSGAERRINTLPSGLQTEFVRGADGTRTTRSADGTQTSLTPGPDPRWGLLAPTTTPATIRTPAGLVGSVSTTRAVTLADPNDPFSLVTLNQTDTINGRTYTSAYSGTSRTFTGTTPSGRRGTATIDALGRPVQLQVAGLNPSVLTYDARGRLVTLTAGSGIDARTLTFSYNSDGYVQTITDPLGRAESFAYDAAGRVTTETLADGRLSRYAYDANGNLTAITPPGRPAHSFSFSPVNLTSAYSPPDVGAGSNETLYTYSADRQMTRMTRPDGQIIESGYDDAGRLNALTIPRGTLGYTYDPATGNLATIGAPGGIGMAYTYDGTLLTSTTWTGPVSGSVSRTYDNNFRVTALAAGGTSISFAYDNDGLLTQAGSLTLSRDAQNGLLTGTRLGSATDTWNYNGFAEPTSYAAAFGGTTIFAQQFTRDKLGRISQKTETVGGVTDSFVYSYDVAGRLTDVAQNGPIIASYTYDSNGNRLSITRPGGTINGSYDDQDRLLQYGAATYAYTANGELQSKTVGGQTTTYEYDALGNLMAVTLPSGTQIIYLVDGNNRRIGKQVNGTLTQGFLYQDGLKPVAELDGSNDVVSRFVYATRTNVPEYMIKGGVTYRIITDHLGSPRLVINASTGAIAQRIDYDEFGNTTLDTNPSFQPFGFAGGLYDRDTQLVRFGLRDYDPQTGRWTAKDPILFAGGDVNLFGYVLNDPVNQTDPIGFQPQLNLFGKANEKALANNIPSEPNVFIVAGHANPERFAGLTPKQLWDKIRTSPQWKPGMKVELVGCRAGKGPGSFAEKLATDFAGDVLASDEFIHPHASGEITMSATRTGPEVPVKWKEFKVDVPLGGKEPVEITLP